MLTLFFIIALTLSTDGTTHRHTNYESRHVAYQHPDSGEIQIRSLGIGSAVDHTSETQVQGLKKRIEDIASTFSDSPLAKHRPEVIIAIQQLIPSLPHIKPVVTTFFRGALETWERFTSEFCDGGDISKLTEAEQTVAFMPSTNDINEGALGTYRNNQRAKPRNTLCGFNAAFTYNMNEGNIFSKKYLSDNESQAYLRRKARELDKSQMERQREKEQVEADEQAIAAKKVKANEKRQREQEKAERIAATQLILDQANVAKMTNAQIDEQLDVHRQWDKDIPIKAWLKLKADKLEALLAAISRYNTAVTSRSADGKHVTLGEHEEDQEYGSDYEMNLS
jgi:hypothetical protein